jgi:hypothetical protein
MNIFLDTIKGSNHDMVLDKVVNIHLSSDFNQVDMDTDEFKNHALKTREGYQVILDKLLSYGSWTWFRDEYDLFFHTGKDLLDSSPFVDVCLLNKNFEQPDESLKPWGGNSKDKDDAPDGCYNCNYHNHNKFTSISFMPWRVTVNLDFEVDESVGGLLDTTEDLIAEYIYAISFDGFTETSYFELKNSLKQRLDDIDMGKEKLIDWEDAEKDIKDWAEDRTPSKSTEGKYKVKISETALDDLKKIIKDDDGTMNDCETD